MSWICYDGEAVWDDSGHEPDPDRFELVGVTETIKVMHACGHEEEWEYLAGTGSEAIRIAQRVCSRCAICPDCGRKMSEGIHDPFGECS